MTDAWPSIKTQEFEYVSAGSGAALVRVSGKPPRRRAGQHRPTLLVDDGRDVHRFAAIPGAPDPKGLLRAAYAIPSVLIKTTSKFRLEHQNGSVTQLPAPTQRVGPTRLDPERRGAVAFTPPADNGASEPPEPSAEPEPEQRAKVLAEVSEPSEALAESERAAAEPGETRRLAEAELARWRQPIAEQQEQIEALEHELNRSRDQLRVMAFERDELSRQAAAFDGVAAKARERAASAETANEQLRTTLSELQTWSEELERRLTATTSELGVATAAGEADERELERLRELIAEAGAGSGSPEQAADAARISLETAHRRPPPPGPIRWGRP